MKVSNHNFKNVNNDVNRQFLNLCSILRIFPSKPNAKKTKQNQVDAQITQ